MVFDIKGYREDVLGILDPKLIEENIIQNDVGGLRDAIAIYRNHRKIYVEKHGDASRFDERVSQLNSVPIII